MMVQIQSLMPSNMNIDSWMCLESASPARIFATAGLELRLVAKKRDESKISESDDEIQMHRTSLVHLCQLSGG